MNGKTRKKFYKLITFRDGEFCHDCEKLSSQGQLVVDHIDNNNANNAIENLQLLCRSCNYKKNPRPVDLCVSNSSMEDAISINRSKEPKFREFVYNEISNERQVLWDDLISSGAEFVEISLESAKRYLTKMISKYGKLERIPTFSLGWAVRYKESLISPQISS